MNYLNEMKAIRQEIHKIDNKIYELLNSKKPEHVIYHQWLNIAKERAELYDYLLVAEKLHERYEGNRVN